MSPEEVRTDNPLRNGLPLFLWHLENARTKKVKVKLEDKAEEAFVVQKERPGSPKKMDSAASGTLAFAAMKYAVKKQLFPQEYARASW